MIYDISILKKSCVVEKFTSEFTFDLKQGH